MLTGTELENYGPLLTLYAHNKIISEGLLHVYKKNLIIIDYYW